jgi:hypothetical protein
VSSKQTKAKLFLHELLSKYALEEQNLSVNNLDCEKPKVEQDWDNGRTILIFTDDSAFAICGDDVLIMKEGIGEHYEIR